MALADSVAASAAIPFAFAPPPVTGTRNDEHAVYTDGGLVSNLPAWCFTLEKRALERKQGGPPIPVLAFSLNGTKPLPDRHSRLRRGAKQLGLADYIAHVLQTGIFGSQSIIGEFVSDLFPIKLPTSLDTFSFACTRAEACAARESGYEAASLALRRKRQEKEVTERLLDNILADVKEKVAVNRAAAGLIMPRLRLCLVDPAGPARSPDAEFRVTATTNMEADADDRLTIDPRNTAAPLAFAQRKPAYADLTGLSSRDLWMTKYEHALITPTLRSMICIPVFGRPITGGIEPPAPQRVLCLDSSDGLQGEFGDSKFMGDLTDASRPLSLTLIEEFVK